MKKYNLIQSFINEHLDAINKIDSKIHKNLDDIIQLLVKTFNKNSKVFFCGNGGSAADAQHLTAEFLIRLRPNVNRSPLPAIALSSLDSSTFTAMINDYDPSDIFLRPFQALANKNDVLVVISTSGNSKNILNLVKFAKKNNFKIIGLLGKNGGLISRYCNYKLIVNSQTTARIQELHIMFGHIIAEIVERKIFNK